MVLDLHHVPGRLRVRLAGLRGYARAIVPLHSELLAIPGVKSASIRAHSGSVTIFYDRGCFEIESFWSTLRRLGYLDAASQTAESASPSSSRMNAVAATATATIAEAIVGEVVKHVLGRSAGALIRLIV
ncbi:HMA2 domain-containing protein [Methylosinus sp. Ce-a6]|uniref:HMA2 domain-containing protein n=1 Tax=Methylosinus sp. Ce-a6 TaxID=2172005 RepID=UPI00135AE21E|nr:hypothetical protein [Methylosinus sp. Ce-a6]